VVGLFISVERAPAEGVAQVNRTQVRARAGGWPALKFLSGVILVMAFGVTAFGCADKDKQAWQEADEANTVAAFETYLQERPEGKFADQARERIDALDWEEAEESDSVSGYEKYLREHPAGKFTEQAREKIDELDWQSAGRSDTVVAYEKYLRDHPRGNYADQAAENIDALHWQEAETANTISSYQQYLARMPSGRQVAHAETWISSLINDDSRFFAAQQQGTRESYDRFLADYPGHRREVEARAALEDIARDAEGQHIIDLIAQNKVEVISSGSGIENVSLNVRRLVGHPVTVLIPVGTFFVSGGIAQDMVTTSGDELSLDSNETLSIVVSAACANIDRPAPGPEDSFRIERLPQQGELERAVAALSKANTRYRATEQAAVWIVTDNANYDALGRLVSVPIGQIPLPGVGTRAIAESTAAEAMKILDDAGIDITQKAIWLDRGLILQGLQDAGLKAWLEQRGA
jgi:outer membrane protein assembly factor BamD (BamD/ComL family)